MFRFICKIGWASLLRRRLRSLLVILMITTSLWGLLLMEGVYEGMTEQMIDNAIRSDSGDITIYAKGYRDDNDLKRLIPDTGKVESAISSIPEIKSYTKRLIQDCLVATAHYSQNATLLGVNLTKEKRHGRLDQYISKGHFSFGKKRTGVLVGYKLAKKLKTDVGKKLILSAQDSSGEISSIALRVSGILKTNNMLLDSRALLMDLEKSAEMLQVENGVTRISLILSDRDMTESVQTQLQKTLPELELFRWDQLYPALMQGKVMMDGFNLVTSIIVFTVASLGIFGVMMVSVLERLREFGIMMAVGTRYSHLTAIVLSESVILGIAGYLSGSLLGYLTLLYFKTYGLDLSVFSEGIETFGMDSISYASIHADYFITAGIAVMLATLSSIIVPLRILKKVRPVEVIQAM